MDEVLAAVAETIKNFAVIYLVDITEVPDFNTMYELYDPSTVMFLTSGTSTSWLILGQETTTRSTGPWRTSTDIAETVYRGARKGRGLVIAPKDYSTKYRY
jgi:U5 snRNP protein, DIM1 family